MATRRGIGASLAESALAYRNVVSIAVGSERGGDLDRSASFVLDLPFEGGERQCLDLSFLVPFRNLALPLFEGLRIWSVDKTAKSRLNKVTLLQLGFLTYLQETESSDLGLCDIELSDLVAFQKWVGRSLTNEGKARSSSYCQDLFYVLKPLLEALQCTALYRSDAERILKIYPARCFPGAKRKSKPRDRLSREHLVEIIRAAEKEVIQTINFIEEGRHLIDEGSLQKGSVIWTSDSLRSKAATLVCLSDFAVLPTLANIKASAPVLANALVRHGGSKALTRYLFPSPRDLVPFALLIGVASTYNPDTLLALSWDEVHEERVFGVRQVRLTGTKNRSKTQPIPLAADAVDRIGLGVLLDTLRAWTSRIRTDATPRNRRKVFLFVPLTRSVSAKAFGNQKYGPAGDITWTHNLKLFCEAHRIEKFSLAQLRTTVLDEAQECSGDIMVAQRLGRHRDPATTWSHYTSGGTRQRYKERFGSVLLVRERWIETEGIVDPRERAEHQDLGAATPGFLCFDPFDSPQPGQKQGRLCSAYGRCPSCPMTAADPNNVINAASYLALQRAIESTAERLSPEVFVEQWGEVLGDLNGLISRIPAEVLDEASGVIISLPPVD